MTRQRKSVFFNIQHNLRQSVMPNYVWLYYRSTVGCIQFLVIIFIGLSLISYLQDDRSSLHHCCPSSHFLHHRSNSHECKMWYICRVFLKLSPPNNFVILEQHHKHQTKHCGLNSDQLNFLMSQHPSFFKPQLSVNRISFWNAVSTKTGTMYNIKNINQKDNYWPLSQTFRFRL
jgi:hypothetical protein